MKRKILITLFIVIFTGVCFAQNTVKFDDAIKESADQITLQIIMKNTLTTMDFTEQFKNISVALLDFAAPSVEISEYIYNELTKYFLINPRIKLVDRQNLDKARDELNFNMSSEVDDKTAQGIGHFIGAQVVVFCSLKKLGNNYRFLVRAITVETGEVQGIYTANITENSLKTIFGTLDPPIQRQPNKTSISKSSWEPPKVNPSVFFYWGVDAYPYKIILEIGLQPGIAFDTSKDNYLSLLLDINGGLGFDTSYQTSEDGFLFSIYNIGGLIDYRFARKVSIGIGGGMGGMNDNIFPYIRGAVSVLFYDGNFNVGVFYDYNFDYGYRFGIRMYGNLLNIR